MQKHGIPVGAVVLPGPCISSFHKECRKAFPEAKHLRFRGMENHDAPSTTANNNTTYKAIHVQTEVAASLLDGDTPSIVEFIHRHGGYFLPGVRMKKDTRRRGEEDFRSKNPLSPPHKFTFVELFAGVGGFRMGLEPIGGSCVLASEKNEFACAFYRRHFGTNPQQANNNSNCYDSCPELVEGDVLDVVSDDFPEGGVDLLTAGFPCQPFSARGKRKGLDDDGHRGQMYQELVRILIDQQPPFFLFENVVGLVTMDGGRRNRVSSSDDHDERQNDSFEAGKTMETILEAFGSCGYKVEWHVVNCKHFCPQHRERVYFFGSLLELDCPDMVWENIYPKNQETKTKTTSLMLRDFLEQDYSTCPFVEGCELSETQWEMVKTKCGNGSTEEALTRSGLKIDEALAPTLISSYKTPASLSTRFVTEEADGTPRHGDVLRPRFLTPKEFRKIMGFPETFEVTTPPPTFRRGSRNSNRKDDGESLKSGIADGHVYKVLGNAVVPPVVEAIGREILRLKEEVDAKTKRM